jgi:N-acetylneuraminic acid mutarotase
MKHIALLSTTALVAMGACSSGDNLTQPGPDQAPSFAAASNTWTLKAAPHIGVFASSAGAAPNAAGDWIVYKFGGRDGSGGTGWPVEAYNVATNTWTTKSARVGVFNSNGVAKISTQLYFSGGSPEVASPSTYTNAVWAYDYTNDVMIRRASLPIVSGEGVSGAIDGNLYVLPGVCSGEAYPNPGYCAEDRTRRFYRYDPGTDTWAARTASPHYHRLGAAGVLGGKLYVAAGFSNFTKVANLDVYDPATNSWKTLAPVPTGGGANGAVLGGRFYVVTAGGTYAYNPATNTWTSRASPSEAHDDVVTVRLNGAARLMAVGGSHGSESDIPNDSEMYTP